MGKNTSHRMNNKGFSLVELIIVIAIMAILVGVLAPNLIRYIERSKIAADIQVMDTIRTIFITAMIDSVIEPGSDTSRTDILSFFVSDGGGGMVSVNDELLRNGGVDTPFGKSFATGLGFPDIATLLGPDGLGTKLRQKHNSGGGYLISVYTYAGDIVVRLQILMTGLGHDEKIYYVPINVSSSQKWE